MSTQNTPRTVIGLTGGIGAGKSEVAALLEASNFVVIDADILAREVVEPGSAALTEISSRFGQTFLRDDGTLDRKRLGELIFRDTESRAALEAIVHPRIREKFVERVRQIRANPEQLRGVSGIVYVIPLLAEARQRYPELGRIVVVTAEEETRVRRIMARDRLSEAAARDRIASQAWDEERLMLADDVIINNGSRAELRSRVDELVLKLR